MLDTLLRPLALAGPLRLITGSLLLAALLGGAEADEAKAPARIVSVGGAVTEIVYALGAGDRLAAVDTTSVFPAAATALPSVGYKRALAAEGVLSLAPDLILAEQGAGPPDVLAILDAGRIPVVHVPDAFSAAGIGEKIAAVGGALGREADAAKLADAVAADFAALAADTAAVAARKRVLFVLSLSGGRPTVAGTGTAADAIIRLAGGVNAMADVAGYKPAVDEAILAAAPDVILTMTRGQHETAAADVFALPAFAATPAAASGAFIGMDGAYLLGFGPRTPAAARDLAARLYPGVIAAPPAGEAGQ